MIIVERVEDSTDLIKTYSDAGMMILQEQTGIMYAEAIDVDYAGYTYVETDVPIGQEEESDLPDGEISDEEAIDITKPTPTEKKLWDAQDERTNNNKIIKAFFGNNLIDLAKKYHLNLSEYNDATVGLDFNCQSDIVEFFKIAINELIMTKLKEQGLEGTLDEKVILKGLNKVWLYGPVVDNIRVNQTALQ